MVKARDQDLMTFFGAAQGSDNRRVVTQFFKENYDKADLSLCSLTCTDPTCSDLEAVRGELLVHVCRAGMIARVCVIPARAEQAHLVRIRDAGNREGPRGDGRVLQGIITARPGSKVFADIGPGQRHVQVYTCSPAVAGLDRLQCGLDQGTWPCVLLGSAIRSPNARLSGPLATWRTGWRSGSPRSLLPSLHVPVFSKRTVLFWPG
jgi:hypothetical protein